MVEQRLIQNNKKTKPANAVRRADNNRAMEFKGIGPISWVHCQTPNNNYWEARIAGFHCICTVLLRGSGFSPVSISIQAQGVEVYASKAKSVVSGRKECAQFLSRLTEDGLRILRGDTA